MERRRLANAYLSTVISISLVLLLVGIATLLLLNARSVSNYFKENMQVSVLLKPEVEETEALEYKAEVDSLKFIRSSEYVSKEQGIAEMSDMLGSDFLSVFETSPVPISVVVNLKAEYVATDSLDLVTGALSSSPLVDEVVYQKSLVSALNQNIEKITLFLGVFIALLLFISFVLINNTVRLNVFSRRFTIRTMRLVGATKAFIRAPFLGQAVLQGFIAASLAVAYLGVILYVIHEEFAQLFAILSLPMMFACAGVMVCAGIVICVLSTYFVVGKLVSLDKDELYY
ncbi:MAG: permease-like cell division protein FtsX [Bacteroidales bacterium]|nr:permease-like cell division protein FtsX [Bacteroidales bacterium]